MMIAAPHIKRGEGRPGPAFIMSASAWIISTVFLLALPLAPFAVEVSGVDCSPCSCKDGAAGMLVTCRGVPMAQVLAVFRHQEDVLFQMNLIPPASDKGIVSIPAGLTVKTNRLILTCPSLSDRLQVDPRALRSTKAFTTYLKIDSCDLSGLDFAFLAGFDQLTDLELDSSSGIHSLSTLPPLPAMTTLSLASSSGLNSLAAFPSLARGLKELNIWSNPDLDDFVAARLLTWLLDSSGRTLQTLSMTGSQRLTVIPSERLLSAFENLRNVDLSGNSIPAIKLLSFSAPVTSLQIGSSGLTRIHPGAFEGGNLQNAYVDLCGNQLDRFESSVFQGLLEEMMQAEGSWSTLAATDNPFDCHSDPCHLAWLIRDNRPLLSKVEGASCSNGTAFTDLDPKGFTNCPSKSVASKPVLAFDCPNPYGLYSNPSDPWTYFKCFQSVPYLTKCPYGPNEAPGYSPCNDDSKVPCCFKT